jgi:D-alanyl-lipoteichoic acid acyltransferase DltB (MBOAT superfamily)
MLFNSLEFWFFFTAVFVLYLSLRGRGRLWLILIASYVFYGAWDWRFLSLIAFSTMVDYVVGLGLQAASDQRSRKLLVATSVVVNLGILGIFKYLGFLIDSLGDLLSLAGLEAHLPSLQIVLPVGISFYTFQTLSYSIDIYRGKIAPTRDLLRFAVFVAFFPQLVAGPIERSSRLLPQTKKPRRVTWKGMREGGWLCLWGLFKKVVIADNLAPLVDAVYGSGAQPTGAEVLLATYAFAIQIYCDFSGYTDIARGLARAMGFRLVLNFNLPYLAKGARDFWRRWHISLSTWLRDYLYIPLGGNRGGGVRTASNLMVTMTLGGLWHGAAWTFLFWGIFHGLWLSLDRSSLGIRDRVRPRGGAPRWMWDALAVVLTFHLVCVGWVLFRAPSIGGAVALFRALLVDWSPGLTAAWIRPFLLLVSPLLLVQTVQAVTGDLEAPRRFWLPVRIALYAGLLIGILLFGQDHAAPFIYFQF